jgi:putative mRNA 3-end processing factor
MPKLALKTEVQEFRAYYDNGIVIEYKSKKIIIDSLKRPTKPYDAILITHGHKDHVNPKALHGAYPIIMSEETATIIRIRDNERLRYIKANPGTKLTINDITIEAFNAGHIIGSLSYVLDFKDLRIGITGDFNVESSIILNGNKSLPADIIIMEATYGDPDYVFPSRKTIYNELKTIIENNTKSGNVLLMGQPLGRGQELTALLKDYPIYIEPNIKILNNALGLKYGKVLSDLPETGSIIITGTQKNSMNTINILKTKYSLTKTIALSGMYARESRTNRLRALGIEAIPLSSHSDFPGLVDFVLNSEAKFIYTVYGNAVKFAKYLRKELNIMARPLPTPNQLSIDSFL